MVIAWSYFVEGKIKLKIYQTNCSCMLCPHNQHDADEKDAFYQQLQAAVETVPTYDMCKGNLYCHLCSCPLFFFFLPYSLSQLILFLIILVFVVYVAHTLLIWEGSRNAVWLGIKPGTLTLTASFPAPPVMLSL